MYLNWSPFLYKLHWYWQVTNTLEIDSAVQLSTELLDEEIMYYSIHTGHVCAGWRHGGGGAAAAEQRGRSVASYIDQQHTHRRRSDLP